MAAMKEQLEVEYKRKCDDMVRRVKGDDRKRARRATLVLEDGINQVIGILREQDL